MAGCENVLCMRWWINIYFLPTIPNDIQPEFEKMSSLWAVRLYPVWDAIKEGFKPKIIFFLKKMFYKYICQKQKILDGVSTDSRVHIKEEKVSYWQFCKTFPVIAVVCSSLRLAVLPRRRCFWPNVVKLQNDFIVSWNCTVYWFSSVSGE